MTQATIAEVKRQFDRYITLVRKGAVIRVLEGDTAVAEIVPIPRPARDRRRDIGVLDSMERSGSIRRGTGRINAEILESDPPGEPCGVLDALLAERQER